MTSTPETDVSVMRAQAPHFTGTPGRKAFWDLRCIMQYLRSMWVSSGGLLSSTRQLDKSGKQQAVLMVAVAAGAVVIMVEAAVVQMVAARTIAIVA